MSNPSHNPASFRQPQNLPKSILPPRHRFTDGDEEDIPLPELSKYLVKPLAPLPESELQRPQAEKEERKVRSVLSVPNL